MSSPESGSLDQSHLDDWRERIQTSADAGLDQFLSYFDTSENPHESWMQGYWDFSYHILKPIVPTLLGEPYKATALEIGFGGGRLLGAASRFFEKVIGVDIHENFDEVRVILEAQGVANFELIKGDGATLPVPSDSIDFVYSYIVLQHLPRRRMLEDYLVEIKRALKHGRPACLYFGHLPFNWRGIRYLDLETRKVESTRENTLLLRPSETRRLLKKAGLRIVEMGRPPKKPWRAALGEQHYAIVVA